MRFLVRSTIAVSLLGGAVLAALAAGPQPGTQPSGPGADAPFGAARALSASAQQASAQQVAGARTSDVSPSPRVGIAARFDVSPPLRSLTPLPTVARSQEANDDPGPPGTIGDTRHDPDPVLQSALGAGAFSPDVAPIGANFDGMTNGCNCAPPDPNGAIGPNHYVQMVNLQFSVYSRTGTSLYGPAAINTIFAGFGGPCQLENAGDPVVVHDQLADRWLLSQFTSTGPAYYQCVAVSTTADPTGTYYRYAFSTGTNFADYPKYGVWPDAYYISTREFAGGVSFVGVGAYALNRAQMLAGNPAAQVVSFLFPPGGQPYRTGDGLLPSDLDGTTLPPAGSPNYFVGSMDSGTGTPYGAPADALNLFKFHVDFATPASSTFAFTNQLNIASYDTVFPCTPTSRACIPQPAPTTNKIDILSYRQRPLFRLAYRNFGTHESLVTNQSVEAATGIAGIRWWEIRSPNSSPVVFQEGTYGPGATDGIHRWMGSLAMDRLGNMALGYSVSDGANVFPGIRYTGRLVTDPPGVMSQGEGTIVNGTGSQTGGGNRWGDYTAMSIDPVDDCTFWYTDEYYATTSPAGWNTRIASFKYPGCAGPTAVKVLRLSARWHKTTVLVSWQTGSEIAALGYHVYRSAGTRPFRRVNRSLVVAKHSVAAGETYRLIDRSVRRGVAYRYRLQIVDRAGKRTWASIGIATS